MSESKPIKLVFTNAAEDLPRLVTAYGRGWGGEVALVLRPAEAVGLFVWASRGKGRQWEARGSDALERPQAEEPVPELLEQLRQAQKQLPDAGPITLRGQWSGVLVCREEGPVVELARPVSSYVVVRVQSAPGGWRWQVERKERWFGQAHNEQGEAPFLSSAISDAMRRVLRIVGDACSVRDTRRRGALDPVYAVKHPVRPAKEPPAHAAERFKPSLPRPKAEKPAKADGSSKAPKAPPRPRASKPLTAQIGTANALLEHNQGLTQALLDDPSPQTAKAWVKAALAALGLRAASLRTRPELRPGGGGGFALSLVIDPPEDPTTAQRGRKILADALSSPSGPPLRLDTWALASGEAPAPRKRGKAKAPPEEDLVPPELPLPPDEPDEAEGADPRDQVMVARIDRLLSKMDLGALL